MSYKQLFILVEGLDDERFFQKVIIPFLKDRYNTVTIWQHAGKMNKIVKNFLKSIRAMHSDYIYVADINHALCITEKKGKIKSKISSIDQDRIIIVKSEIESWYLAGLDTKSSGRLGITFLESTDGLTKEQFNNMIPKRFDSRIDFMQEILKFFSPEKAKGKNKTFRYFLEKYCC